MRSSDWSSDGCSSDLVFRTEMVQLNTKKKPFDDQRVRQALNYAVNKDALIQGVLRGNGTPAVSSLPVMAYHNDDLKPYPLDIEKAKALLAEAGYPDGFTTSLLVPSRSEERRVGTESVSTCRSRW